MDMAPNTYVYVSMSEAKYDSKGFPVSWWIK